MRFKVGDMVQIKNKKKFHFSVPEDIGNSIGTVLEVSYHTYGDKHVNTVAVATENFPNGLWYGTEDVKHVKS